MDEIDDLITLSDSEGYKALLKILTKYVENEKEKILQFNMNEKSFAQLGIAKARCEGYMELARKLENEISRLVASNTGGKSYGK